MDKLAISTIFTDIGGVILTNGWDRNLRRKAADIFHLDLPDMEERHHLTFDTYEEGKLSLDEYLTHVVFYEPRPFSISEFKNFMFAQSQPFPDMIDLIRGLKARYHLEIAAISNEGRELTVFRINKFGLTGFVDFFISSCFVHFRKPDKDIYRIALDISQTPIDQAIYIDDRQMFTEIACTLGLKCIHHTGFASTRDQLAELGLK